MSDRQKDGRIDGWTVRHTNTHTHALIHTEGERERERERERGIPPTNVIALQLCHISRQDVSEVRPKVEIFFVDEKC